MLILKCSVITFFKLSSSGKSGMGIILILAYRRNDYVCILTPRKPESSRMLTHEPKVTEIQCESNLPSKASFSFHFPLSPPSFGWLILLPIKSSSGQIPKPSLKKYRLSSNGLFQSALYRLAQLFCLPHPGSAVKTGSDFKPVKNIIFSFKVVMVVPSPP